MYALILGASPINDLPIAAIYGVSENRFKTYALTEGAYPKKGEVILGKNINARLHSPKFVSISNKTFTVSGIFENGVGFEDGGAVLNREDASAIFNKEASILLVSMERGTDAEELIERINAQSSDIEAKTTHEFVDNYNQFKIIETSSNVISAVAFLMGLLGIASLISITINERRSEFGILRAIGKSSNFIITMVVGETFVITCVGYIGSVAHRIFIGELSYNQEWFFQYLTFCYVPLLIKWCRAANITFKSNPFLVIAVYSFLFVDIEGNILFIPSLRWLFHRNDLVVAHAHIAMGVSVFFMAMAVVSPYLKKLNHKSFSLFYTLGFTLMLIALSMAGMMEAGFMQADISLLWTIRMLCGLFILLVTMGFFYPQLGLSVDKIDTLKLYHLTGFLSDALGGIFLFAFASTLYPLLGFGFEGKYEYIVFAFMTTTGILHLFGLTHPPFAQILAKISAFNRIAVSAMFLSLYLSHQLGVEAMLIAVYDLSFASVYVIFASKLQRRLYV